MDKIIVYVDDAAYVQDHLRPAGHRAGVLPEPPASLSHTHWVVVACAPRMTQRVSKWVSHRAREHWRNKWSDKLFAELAPLLQAHGDRWTGVVATGPLPELTRGLMEEHGTTQVLDLRRPKLSPAQQPLPPVPFNGKLNGGLWSTAGLLAGLGLVLGLSIE